MSAPEIHFLRFIIGKLNSDKTHKDLESMLNDANESIGENTKVLALELINKYLYFRDTLQIEDIKAKSKELESKLLNEELQKLEQLLNKVRNEITGKLRASDMKPVAIRSYLQSSSQENANLLEELDNMELYILEKVKDENTNVGEIEKLRMMINELKKNQKLLSKLESIGYNIPTIPDKNNF